MAKQTAVKPQFMKDFEEATGAGDSAAKTEQAAEHFVRKVELAERLHVSISAIRPMKNNPRAELGDLSALVKSIETNGFVGALAVRDLGAGADEELYEVWAGNRRLAAAKQAGLTTVPCDVYELTEVQALELNLTEQINRSDLSPLEEGEACRSLMELSGYTTAQVAAKLGQSTSWVTKRVALCGLAPEVRKALAKGETSLTVAQALAALPSQKAQVDALKAMDKLPEWDKRKLDTAEAKVEWLREQCARPLSGATWKLTDETLVPEAGACSTCPHNSATAKMLGLFDNPKAKPACANVSCFDGKLRAAWEKKSAKAAAAGAKVLTLAEGKKLFPREGAALPYASRYVDANVIVQEDKAKRTWKQVLDEVPDDARPKLHLAQGVDGKARELYVGDDALAAVAAHLKLKWATKGESAAPDASRSRAAEDEERSARATRRLVSTEAHGLIAVKLLAGLKLPDVRLHAKTFESHVPGFLEATGIKAKAEPEKWITKVASQAELQAFVWWCNTSWLTDAWDDFDEDLMAACKAHGIDLAAMAKAKLDAGQAA